MKRNSELRTAAFGWASLVMLASLALLPTLPMFLRLA